MMVAKKIEIKGVVQGVGFRPFVYRIAHKWGIKGWVLNNSQGVFIHAEGTDEILAPFLQELFTQPPRQSIIKEYQIREGTWQNFLDFSIITSKNEGEQEVLISPDLALCPDCYQEVLNKHDRRFQYPFTNCTNCGPRFTIIRSIPYDRPKTTMADFPMCSVCEKEYHNPLNRRFHAQPNACPQCGPQLKLYDNQKNLMTGINASQLLTKGNILAIKGLGGYHLVCNALDREAVNRLRKSKKREYKPFALMAKNTNIIKKYCYVTKAEQEILESPIAPIVILNRKAANLPAGLTPGVKTLGVMLPYTPLHLLLFQQDLDLLVMTSGNISSNPLIYQDQDAFQELAKIVDYFLTHNRDIYNRCDDSIVKIINNQPQIFRRARGYVPLPVEIPEQPSILACGGDLKSTFCLTKGNKAFLSQHMGDLDNFNNFQEYILTVRRMQKYLAIKPKIVVVDLHPGYTSHQWGREQELPVIQVQHHHAHLASCLADNRVNEKTLGVICDGTGLGTDGNIWGMEFLLGDFADFERLAHLEYIPLPGGEKAVKEPLTMTISYLYQYLGKEKVIEAQKYFSDISLQEINLIITQIEKKINTPLTSSCGRLFDAVSALLGVCTKVDYEGQAAIELEEIANKNYSGPGYFFELKKDKDKLLISTSKMWSGILQDISRGIKRENIAAKFHTTVAQMIVTTCKSLENKLPSPNIALSGGVMQNKLLLEKIISLLEKEGFNPLVHKQVPANDGGLSLGQAAIGGRIANVCSCSS